jgi:hypothetical protein
MPREAAARTFARRSTRSRARRKRRWRRPRLWPSAKTRRKWLRVFRTAPATAQLVILCTVVAGTWLTVNGLYQVIRKPSELFFPVSGVLHKTPQETWSAYASTFRRHATDIITPEFLAALAQAEASGNPIARTYWRWSWKSDPFDIYRPASSAVGMYQITDGTFAEARKYCVHDHRVVADGPWNDWRSCWFNSLYTRTIPSHAVEMTSAYLDHNVRQILGASGLRTATLAQQQRLAAVVHLCGVGAGIRFARNGLRFARAQRCGDHDPGGYVARVEAMQRVFARLSAADH